MAKINSLAVRKARGTMGGMVYAVVGGQSTVREKATDVSNPKTSAQMSRRVMLANLVNLYKLNKEWMKKLAFEGRPKKLSVYNEFIKANINAANIPLTKTEAGNGQCYFQPDLVFTKGSLPRVSAYYDDDTHYFLTDLLLGSGGDAPEIDTVASLSTLIINNNSNWKNGDQLSLIYMMIDANEVTHLISYEVILNVDDNTSLDNLPVGLNLKVGTDGTSFYVAFDNSNLASTFPGIENTNSTAFLIVQSQTVNGATIVSPARLVLSDAAMDFYVDDLQTTERLAAAVESYGVSEEPFLSSLS